MSVSGNYHMRYPILHHSSLQRKPFRQVPSVFVSEVGEDDICECACCGMYCGMVVSGKSTGSQTYNTLSKWIHLPQQSAYANIQGVCGIRSNTIETEYFFFLNFELVMKILI